MMEVTEDGFRELAWRSAASPPASRRARGRIHNLETLPRLLHAALEGFSSR